MVKTSKRDKGSSTGRRSMLEQTAQLITALHQHPCLDEAERIDCREIAHFVEQSPQWWDRNTLPGHVTGSAFISSPDFRKVLLHHHRKLDRWLQMGGHDEGDADPFLTAVREAREESGLQAIQPHQARIMFDVDIHSIPMTSSMPAHEHLDIRYLLIADPNSPLIRDDQESLALEWFTLPEAHKRMPEDGGSHRVLEKISALQRACDP